MNTEITKLRINSKEQWLEFEKHKAIHSLINKLEINIDVELKGIPSFLKDCVNLKHIKIFITTEDISFISGLNLE
jgi:hypothetical protein